eukprot:gnl/TRDRNA2_/TRDRNA2_149620_c0_seq2.p1 gnl/TRDRNA2_/TRDRNA2_149620_c0~~gnl/TRDRNA2_/TRDRNA2_149620_c0_seq2.p1  ORF type:complete len:142 (-),score=9.66 gnl/TRDRNA2_/TRDRNA2_149620_c0_seq2:31-456(-)
MWPLRSCAISVYRFCTGGASTAASITEWRTATCTLMGLIVLMAWSIPSVKSVMAVGGAVGGAFIVFIYPAAFHIALVKRARLDGWLRRENIPQLFMIGFGIAAGILCLTVAVANAVRTHSTSGKVVDLYKENCVGESRHVE